MRKVGGAMEARESCANRAGQFDLAGYSRMAARVFNIIQCSHVHGAGTDIGHKRELIIDDDEGMGHPKVLWRFGDWRGTTGLEFCS